MARNVAVRGAIPSGGALLAITPQRETAFPVLGARTQDRLPPRRLACRYLVFPIHVPTGGGPRWRVGILGRVAAAPGLASSEVGSWTRATLVASARGSEHHRHASVYGCIRCSLLVVGHLHRLLEHSRSRCAGLGDWESDISYLSETSFSKDRRDPRGLFVPLHSQSSK